MKHHIIADVNAHMGRAGGVIGALEEHQITTGASHVGIYVGNDMMLHCGDPIQYTSLNSSYWQSHFLAYGRVPAP